MHSERIPRNLSILRSRLPVLRNSLLWAAGCGGWIGAKQKSHLKQRKAEKSEN